MFFDALGSLPLGGIPNYVTVPVPPVSGGSYTGGGMFLDTYIPERRQPKRILSDEELAILLAAYMEYYN